MRTLAIAVVKLYQVSISPLLKQVLGVQAMCRYSPSCSHYAIDVLKQYGILYGSYLAIRRILKCQPFAKQQ